MERSSLILDSIKERLSNPFIFSFIVSWLFYNWQIPIGLFWYDSSTILKLGYNSYFDLISYVSQQEGSFYNPLLISIGITAIIPISKLLFTAFNSIIVRLENAAFFAISKETKVSMSKYLEKTNDNIQLERKLEETIDRERDFKRKYEVILATHQDLVVKADVLTKLNDASFMDGNWDLTYVGEEKQFVLRFFSSQVTYTETGVEILKGHLRFFFRDIRFNRLFFIISGDRRTDIFDLHPEGTDAYTGMMDMGLLSGPLRIHLARSKNAIT